MSWPLFLRRVGGRIALLRHSGKTRINERWRARIWRGWRFQLPRGLRGGLGSWLRRGGQGGEGGAETGGVFRVLARFARLDERAQHVAQRGALRRRGVLQAVVRVAQRGVGFVELLL